MASSTEIHHNPPDDDFGRIRIMYSPNPNQEMVTSTVTHNVQSEPAKSSYATILDSFRKARNSANFSDDSSSTTGHVYNPRRAAVNLAHTPLNRRLKGRHLQMIAIGGSIGTGLFVGSGQALSVAGPGSLLFAFVVVGCLLYCTMQALGEMTVMFPVAGSFSAFATRFIDPAWGFAMGWNYAMSWLIAMPLEIIAATSTLKFWSLPIPEPVSVTIFLGIIIGINLCSVKAFGETEFFFSALKVAAVIGFILLGIIINCAGGQSQGYIGGKYWSDPGAFKSGFKGFCHVLVNAAFAFSGTELVGLAAAETYNPIKSIPAAVKQVFWRIFLFYVTSVLIFGLLVPSNNPLLTSSTGVLASPFVIAIKSAGLNGLDSVMNAVVMISVLSVGNSALFASSRTMAALAEQKQAPKLLRYVDQKGRPLVGVVIGSTIGLLAYFGTNSAGADVFTWLLALSALSALFTWGTICFCHIRFRAAWKAQGHTVDELLYVSPVGLAGSWFGFVGFLLVLIAQFWMAVDPIKNDGTLSAKTRVHYFFSAYLAAPIVLFFFLSFKFYWKTEWVRKTNTDLRTGRQADGYKIHLKLKEDSQRWPRWKKIYNTMC